MQTLVVGSTVYFALTVRYERRHIALAVGGLKETHARTERAAERSPNTTRHRPLERNNTRVPYLR